MPSQKDKSLEIRHHQIIQLLDRMYDKLAFGRGTLPRHSYRCKKLYAEPKLGAGETVGVGEGEGEGEGVGGELDEGSEK